MAGMGRCLCLATLLVLPVLGSDPSWASSNPQRSHPFEQFSRHRISFAYPSHWYVTTRRLSTGIEPVPRFAVGNFRFRRTAQDEGPCLAGIGNQRPVKGVFAYLREALGADRNLSRFPPRPVRFRLPARRDNAACMGPGTRQYSFKDSGRAFYLWMSVGPKATPTARRWFRRLVSGMDIQPR